MRFIARGSSGFHYVACNSSNRLALGCHFNKRPPLENDVMYEGVKEMT